MSVETKNLTKIYKTDGIEVEALKNVNFEIKEGEFISVMGPSGSGKSTLLNLLGALDTPTQGKVLMNGKNIYDGIDLDDFRGKKIGFVFQMHNLIPTLTSLENVEIPLKVLKIFDEERRKRAYEMLEIVGLGDRKDHKPSELSGGERQRVAIARALANDPAIVLADEPTGNLDSKTGLEIINLMRKLNIEFKKTFVIVTHDLEIAKKTDRIVHLKDGRIQRIDEVKSEHIEDLLSLRNSSLGKHILQGFCVDDLRLEDVGIFKDGRLTERGRILREVLEQVEEI